EGDPAEKGELDAAPHRPFERPSAGRAAEPGAAVAAGREPEARPRERCCLVGPFPAAGYLAHPPQLLEGRRTRRRRRRDRVPRRPRRLLERGGAPHRVVVGATQRLHLLRGPGGAAEQLPEERPPVVPARAHQPPTQPESRPYGSVSSGSSGRARRKSKSQPSSACRTWSRNSAP